MKSRQISIVMCEGPHDVAFLRRIYKYIGFKSFESVKIGDYPHPMNDLIIVEAKKTNIESLNLAELRANLLPLNVLKSDENYVFLYSLGGDSKAPARKEILKKLSLLIPAEDEIGTDRIDSNTSLALGYFFDADDNGVKSRIKEINDEILSVFPDLASSPFGSSGEVLNDIKGIKMGNLIFTSKDDRGKLEDILIPLMKGGNEAAFDSANIFLNDHFEEDRLFPLKTKVNREGEVSEKRSTRNRDKEKYDRDKALIGIVGQLQRPGKSSTVVIHDCDFIDMEKVHNFEICKAILEFLGAFSRIQ